MSATLRCRRTASCSWHLRLLERLAPPSVLVDGEYDVVPLSPSAGGCLQFGGGEPTRDLLRAAPAALRIELRAALYQASQSHAAVEVPAAALELPGNASLQLSIRVTPANDIGSELYLVALQEQPAMNEELRPATEELETCRGELQSINEELTTVNHELKTKVEELGHANSDTHSLMDATGLRRYSSTASFASLATRPRR